MNIPVDAVDALLLCLSITDIAQVAVVCAGDLKDRALRAKIRWSISQQHVFGNRWLLRLDGARSNSHETEPATAAEGQRLGWKCTWVESPCSLWVHNLRDGLARLQGRSRIRVSPLNRLFLSPVACPALLTCPAQLHGRWLDTQILALLSLWKPDGFKTFANDVGNSSSIFSLNCDDVVNKVVPLFHVESGTHENMSVEDGNLLAFLAISSRPIQELISPVSLLIEGGAALDGPHILAASRKAANVDGVTCNRWNELMKVAARRNLRKRYSAFQTFLQRSRRPNYQYHVLHGTADSYPEQFRTLTYMDPIRVFPVVVSLENAVVAATAVGLDCPELKGALETMATNPSCMRQIFWDAICAECCFAKESRSTPNLAWLKTWHAIGAEAGDWAWLVPGGVYRFDERSALDYVGRSTVDPTLLVDVVTFLVRAGDWGGFRRNGTWPEEHKDDVVQLAFMKDLPVERARFAWRSAWLLAARNRLNWICARWHDYDTTLLVKVLEASKAVGVDEVLLEHAGMLANESGRERMHQHRQSQATSASVKTSFLNTGLWMACSDFTEYDTRTLRVISDEVVAVYRTPSIRSRAVAVMAPHKEFEFIDMQVNRHEGRVFYQLKSGRWIPQVSRRFGKRVLQHVHVA